MREIEKTELPTDIKLNESKYNRVFRVFEPSFFIYDWEELYKRTWEEPGSKNRLIEFVRNSDYRIEAMEKMIDRVPGWVPVNIDSGVILENQEKAAALALLTGFSFGVSRLTDGPSTVLIAYKVGGAILDGNNIPFDEIGIILAIPAAARVAAGAGLHMYFNHIKKKDVDFTGAVLLSWWPAFYGPIVGNLAYNRLKKINVRQIVAQAQMVYSSLQNKGVRQSVVQTQTAIQGHLARILVSSE